MFEHSRIKVDIDGHQIIKIHKNDNFEAWFEIFKVKNKFFI